MKKLYWQFILVAIPLVLLFQNCGVKAPSVDASLASAGFSHLGTETSCSTCHESKRPTSTANFIALNPSAPFDYSTHGAGVDCISCHMVTSVGFRTAAEWGSGHYTHSPTPTNCQNCHSSQRPTVAVGPNTYTTTAFTHPANVDCVGCHQKSLSTSFNVYSTSSSPIFGDTDWQGGVVAPPKPVDYSGSDFNLTEYIPSWTGTTLTFPTTASATILMSMNHATTTVSSANMDSCVLCHAGAPTGVYKYGYFHTSLTAAAIAQPASCTDCHTIANSNVPAGFVGPVNSTTRNPASPAMNHGAVVWAKNANGTFTQMTTTLVSNNCAQCHQVPTAAATVGNGWNVPLKTVSTNGPVAYFHPSLGASQPTSCLDCHGNSLPTGLVPTTAASTTLTKFNHASDPAGAGDCIGCHAAPTTLAQVQAAGTTAWANGKFHNTTNNATIAGKCNACHDSQRPTNSTFLTANGVANAFTAYDATHKPFDLSATANSTAHGNSLQCDTCHAVSSYTAVVNWANGNFNHATAYANGAAATDTLTSCQTCHNSQRPTVSIGPNTFYAGTFSHTTDGQGDCIGCHMTTVTGGTINGVVVAGKAYANYLTASQTLWGDTDWRGGQGMSLNALMGPNPSAPKTTIAPTPTHINSNTLPLGQIVATNPSPVPQLYDQMLHGSAQVGAVGLPLITSTNPTATTPTNCATCHTAFPTIMPATFHKAAGVTNTNLTSCKDCHINTAPIDIVGAVQANTPMNHAALLSNGQTAVGGLDCITCHGNTRAGTDFTGANFHKNLPAGVLPSNCTTCHFTTVPAGTGAAVTNYTAANLYVTGMKHTSASVAGDCTACHAFTSNAQIVTTITGSTAIPTSWNNVANPGFAFFHKNIPPTAITSCVDCHTTKPLTLTISANDAQHMNHASPNVPAECATCHKGDLTASATPAALPTTWKNTDQVHINIATPPSCQACHGLTNGGGAVAGTGNDIPAGLTNSAKLSASLISGASTIHAQVTHTEADVAAKDCNYCHTTAGLTGNKWKDATFHTNFSSKSMITGNCATCHVQERPANGVVADTAGHVIPDHNPATLGNGDCKSCHDVPGTGTAAAPNWLGASGAMPATITLAVTANTKWGTPTTVTIAHPTQITTNTTHAITSSDCATCHLNYNSTASIIGWDHPSSASSVNCGFCHATTSLVVSATTITTNLGRFTQKAPGHEAGASLVAGGTSTTGLSATTSCVACHQHSGAKPPTWNNTTLNYTTGGNW